MSFYSLLSGKLYEKKIQKFKRKGEPINYSGINKKSKSRNNEIVYKTNSHASATQVKK